MTKRMLVIVALMVFYAFSAVAILGQNDEPCWKKYLTSDVYMTESKALLIAKSIAEHNTDGKMWYEYLACCPATEAEARRLNYIGEKDWIEDTKFIDCFHKGADTCFRSAQTFQSPTTDANHGQQCCYSRGRLLVVGEEGAGTPDFFAPISLAHRNYDVITFGPLGWRTYQQYWKPNSGGNCLFRVYMPKGDWVDTGLEVKVEQQFRISAKGSIVWGVGGSSSGPEGSNTVVESEMAAIFAPPPFPEYKTGSLVGAILYSEYIQSPRIPGTRRNIRKSYFSVGSGGIFTANISGRLWLGINDAIPSNNKGHFDVAIQKVGEKGF